MQKIGNGINDMLVDSDSCDLVQASDEVSIQVSVHQPTWIVQTINKYKRL